MKTGGIPLTDEEILEAEKAIDSMEELDGKTRNES